MKPRRIWALVLSSSGDASTVVSANSTVAAANDFTLEIKATPRETITLPAQSNTGINAGTNGGMAVMADQGTVLGERPERRPEALGSL